MTTSLITHRYKVDRRIIYKELRNKGFMSIQASKMRDWRVNIINKLLLSQNKEPLEFKVKNKYKYGGETNDKNIYT